MNDDAALLRRYASKASEAAFTELVHRHVDLVYGAALRRTGDAHGAADVTQQVFISLARNARKLSRHTVLSAWLHTSTRNASINLMISDQRRKARESEALAVESANSSAGAGADWSRLRPILDSAIDDLPQADRDAVVLRFLERRPFAEIGAVMRVSEDAARMRTERALDKLRAVLARRGITSTAAALGAIVSSQPILAAPLGLSANLASTSMAAAGAGAVTLASFMTTTTIASSLLAAVVAFGAGTYVGASHSFDAAPPPAADNLRQSQAIASLRQSNASLKADTDRMTADVIRLNARLAAQTAAPAPGAKPKVTLGRKQQAMLNNLRQIDAARVQYQLETGHPPASANDLVGVDKYIRQYQPIDGEDYSGVSMVIGQPLSVTTPDGMTVTYDPTGAASTIPELNAAELHVQELGKKLVPTAVQKAVEAYRAANNGNNPPNSDPMALAQYFDTAQQGADWVEYLDAQREAQSN